jgi:hypothetical protein
MLSEMTSHRESRMTPRHDQENEQRAGRSFLSTALLVGVVGSAAAIAWAAAGRSQLRARRASDQGMERRNPMHFFLAGRHPMRRAIDRSGNRPLFERRQSVYDAM